MYLDANNLYGLSMSKPLPYKNFKWSNDLTLDLKKIYKQVYTRLILKYQKNYMINSKIIR